MPRDSFGVYTPPASTWNPAIPSTPISTTDWNALLNDLANGLTLSIAADGSTPATANIPFAFGITGNVTGNVTGNITGNVTGNLTGNSTGTHTGAVAGTTVSASGGFTGNLTGNVTGNVTGNASTATTALTANAANSATTATTTTGTGTVLGLTNAISGRGVAVLAGSGDTPGLLQFVNNAVTQQWGVISARSTTAPLLSGTQNIARVNTNSTSANSGLISWGSSAPGALAEGEVYFQHA